MKPLPILALCAGIGFAPAAAHTQEATTVEEEQTWPVALRTELARLAQVEWRLRKAAGPHCPANGAATGIAIDHIEAYAEKERDFVSGQVGMSDLPTIVAVADNSPAQQAGLLPGDEIVTINGKSTLAMLEASKKRSVFSDELTDHLASLSPEDPIALELRRNGETFLATVQPLNLCASRLILKTKGGIKAHSDAMNVAISQGLLEFTTNDHELALIAGHELAHVIARDESSKERISSKKKEDRADAMGAALTHCAGYDVSLSIDFWTRFRKRDWLGWLRAPTHRSTKKRISLLREQVDDVSCPVEFENSAEKAGTNES